MTSDALSCRFCGSALAQGAVACFRCGKMVERADAPVETTGSGQLPTQLGAEAKAELLEDQWRLIKRIGRGAVGEVWQAQDVTLDRVVAVKLMHEALAGDARQVARFEREARVLADLDHPNLLPVFGMGRSGARPFLVTRLLEGRTLAELMHQRGGRLTPAEAAKVLAPVCDALACLHARGVVHRDLKPSNVFVGEDQRVTLMDLGSALESGSELTGAGELLGTTGYLSPEQIASAPLDGASDIYGLGCLLYEVLTGLPAFPGEPAQVLAAHLAAERPDAAAHGVTPALAELARQAMDRTPSRRPAADAFRAALAPFLPAEAPTGPIVNVFGPDDPTEPSGAPLRISERATAPAPSELRTQVAMFTPDSGMAEFPQLPPAPAPPEAVTREALIAPTHDTQAALKPVVVVSPTMRELSAVVSPTRQVLAVVERQTRPAPSARVPVPRWLIAAVGLAVAGTTLAVLLRPDQPVAPLPPTPLPQSVQAQASLVPTFEPRTPTMPSDEVESRSAAIPVKELSAPPRRKVRQGQGKTPMTLKRKPVGAAKFPALATVELVTTFNDKPLQVGAHVEIDGVYRGQTILRVTLTPGDHLIRIDAGARFPLTEFATSFTPGKFVRLEVELRDEKEARQAQNAPIPGVKAHDHGRRPR